jgi:hypothetical protein
MNDRNIGAEILEGLNEIKQFKKGQSSLNTTELSGVVDLWYGPTSAENTMLSHEVKSVVAAAV